MRIIDFKNLTMKTEIEYKTVDFQFNLKDKMEISYFEFIKMLNVDMAEKIAAANLVQYKDVNLVLQFKTDLKNMDLDPMIPALLTAFVKALNLDKTVYKHGEKILGVPKHLNIDKGFMLDANALDLINYNLPAEKFNIVFFNYKNKATVSIVA
jgi:hypothetical protein